MKRILLVDSDAKPADALAQQVRQKTGWEVFRALDASEALVILGQGSCNAVVSALNLLGGSGPQLFSEIAQRHPGVHRMILGSLDDKQALLKCIGTVHQFLAKPCDASRLVPALERAFAYDFWLPGEAVQRLIGRMTKLPSPPHLFFKVVKEMQSPHASLESVAGLIEQDMAITAKLLQLVNSAAFGLGRPISNVLEAVMFVGLETTRALVLLVHCFSHFDAVKNTDFSPEQLWEHSIRIGQLARVIARVEDASPAVADMCYTAGILHDLGKLILVASVPKEFIEALALSRRDHLPVWSAETQVLGASHAEVGAALMATWGLPPEIVEALAFHHLPTKMVCQGFSPLAAVHAANAIEHAALAGGEPQWDAAYLAELGVTPRLPRWKEACEWELDRSGLQLAAA